MTAGTVSAYPNQGWIDTYGNVTLRPKCDNRHICPNRHISISGEVGTLSTIGYAPME